MAVQNLIQPASQTARFVVNSLGEQTGVLFEEERIHQLQAYIKTARNLEQADREHLLDQLTPVQAIVDGKQKRQAVILSIKRWETLLAWLDEVEVQMNPKK